MPTLSEILEAGRELHVLCAQTAERYGYATSNEGDETGGLIIESVDDPTKRIKVARGAEFIVGCPVTFWGPRVYIDDEEINVGALTEENAQKLQEKMDKAFNDLFSALSLEKQDAERRAATSVAAASEHAKAARRVHNYTAGTLINSL